MGKENDSELQMSSEEAHRGIAVMEECMEKLSFLGSITPDVLQHREELSKFVGDEISRIIHDQRQLETRYEDLITQRSALKGLANKSAYKEVQMQIQDVSRALRESTKNLCRNLKDNPNISGNLVKIQRERSDLIELLSRSCRELAERGTFTALINVVEEDRMSQNRQSELVRREKEATATVKKLEADLSSERGEFTRQATGHKGAMIELKETLSSVKYKTAVDVKYSRKANNAKVGALLRVHRQQERALEQTVKEFEKKKEVEHEAHKETMDFLENKRRQLMDELDSWEEKYATEYGALERKYNSLVQEREEMLLNLDELSERRRNELALKEELELEKKKRMEAERTASLNSIRQNRAAKVIQEAFKLNLKIKVATKGAKKAKGGKKGKKGKK